jgi:hypothetical protein
LALVSQTVAELLNDIGIAIVDTTRRRSDGEIDDDVHHPFTLSELAVNAVQWHREALEQRLAEDWVGRERDILYMDGGISGSRPVAASDRVVGVAKSHRTLYGDPAAVRTVLGLAMGERSSVFAIESPDWRRSSVASWYLRLRDPDGRDPLWGLVRVEVALAGIEATRRADEVSRWILAETAPLALPDGRWDTMVYGIRDCEQFLKAIA